MAGWLKMNVDIAVFNARGLIGLGWVLRDAVGKFKAAKKTSPLPMQIRPHEAEALGVREAFSWLNQSWYSQVVVEMDAQRVFKDLRNPSQAISPYAMLIFNSILSFSSKKKKKKVN